MSGARDWETQDFCLLTTTGRRSGRPHTIEIWFAAHGAHLYILAGDADRSDTVQNVRAHPAVSVRIGEHTWNGAARIVTDQAEAALARALVPQKYAGKEEGLVEWAITALPVAIDLSP